MKTFTLFAQSLLIATVAGSATAAVPHFEGFEDPAWAAGLTNNWQDSSGGTIARVTSGTNDIDSATGNAHAVVNGRGPFTRLGGYSTEFGGGFTTSLDVYLSTEWSLSTGFEYSVAVSQQIDDHLRDFIWHVGVVNIADVPSLIVNASNNTDHTFNSFKLLNENGGNYFTIATSGWYTLEQVFRDASGQLAVDFNLRDADGVLLHSITRTNPADLIDDVVGGNRYGWITVNNVGGGLAIDNTSLVPEPAALSLLGVGAIAMLRRRR